MIPIANSTASENDSVWKGLGEHAFRNTISALAAASKGLPGDPRGYLAEEWERRHPLHDNNQHRLCLRDEQRLADDLAYVAASREGGKAVSAVALEEHLRPPGLTIRLAANRSIPEQVPKQFHALLRLLRAQISERSCVSDVFEVVVKLDRERIHSRLRSRHWKPKDHYRGGTRDVPLYKDLLALLPELCKGYDSRQYHEDLRYLCDIYEAVDGNFADQGEDDERLRKAVQSSSDYCTAIRARTRNPPPSSSENENSPSSTPLQSKHVRLIEKIGRYWDLCVFLTKATCRYPVLFKNTRLETQRPYIPTRILDSVTRKPVRYYVHAEIQLITFYGMMPSLESQMPRVLGVSKSACYLCDLFISSHGQFYISKTHGRLYHQWTVPNLAAFGITQRQQYRTILQKVYLSCKTDMSRSSKINRLCPPESTYDLHACSPLSSIAASTVSHVSSQITIRGPSSDLAIENLVKDVSASTLETVEEVPPASFISIRDFPRSSLVSGQSPPSMTDGIERAGVGATVDRPVETRISESPNPTVPVLRVTNADITEFSIQHPLTHHQPYIMEIPGMSLCFEVEEPKRGKVVIQSSSTASATAVDVDAMIPGDVLSFYREDETSSLHLDFYQGGGRPISIDFEWHPD